jgi:RND family efflux transporter MFP subunit
MMKLFKHTVQIKSVLVFSVIVLLTSCSQQESVSVVKKDSVKTDTVKVFRLGMDSVQKTISLPGDLMPYETVQIRAKMQGYISKMNVDIGSRVSKGQMLALIEAPEIASRIQELNSKEKAAQSRYQSSKDYFDRIRTASASDGVIAPSELERAKNQMQADESEYKAAQSAVASYKQIGNYLAVVAPYNGIITKRNINVGSLVGNTNDQPLFEIENNKVLRLRVAVPEIYTNAELIGNTGELTTRSLPDKKFKAMLTRKTGSIDNDTRSELWEFEIPNPSGALKAGSYADVKLRFFRKGQSLVVPMSAMVTTLERRFIIEVSNGSTRWIDVRPGFNMGDKQEIFGDIHAGDTIVQKGNEELKSGTPVNKVSFIK